MTAVGYVDPGSLEADIAVGTRAKYSMIWWNALVMVMAALCFQALSGRLGVVTRTDLADHVGSSMYSRTPCMMLWSLMQLSIVTSDIQETMACGLAIQMFSRDTIPLLAACLLGTVASYLLLSLERLPMRRWDMLYASLILVETLALAVACSQAKPIARAAVAQELLTWPSLSFQTITVAAGALGAMIMPAHLFFQSFVPTLHAQGADTGDSGKRSTLRLMGLEAAGVAVGTFAINTCAVLLFGGSLRGMPAGMESAGDYLWQAHGMPIRMLWATALLASSLAATLYLTHAGQVIMQGLMHVKLPRSWHLLLSRCFALACIALTAALGPSYALDRLARGANLVQALLLPFALVPLISATASEDVMGLKWVSRGWRVALAVAAVGAVLAINAYLLISFVCQYVEQQSAVAGLCTLLVGGYMALVAYFAAGPDSWPQRMRRAGVLSHKAFMWLKTHRRWADIESMLEVHF